MKTESNPTLEALIVAAVIVARAAAPVIAALAVVAWMIMFGGSL